MHRSCLPEGEDLQLKARPQTRPVKQGHSQNTGHSLSRARATPYAKPLLKQGHSLNKAIPYHAPPLQAIPFGYLQTGFCRFEVLCHLGDESKRFQAIVIVEYIRDDDEFIRLGVVDELGQPRMYGVLRTIY